MSNIAAVGQIYDDIESAPIGAVRDDLSIGTTKDILSSRAISIIALHLAKKGYTAKKEGEWIHKITVYDADECECSVCGQTLTTHKGVRKKFCPECGSPMKGATPNAR